MEFYVISITVSMKLPIISLNSLIPTMNLRVMNGIIVPQKFYQHHRIHLKVSKLNFVDCSTENLMKLEVNELVYSTIVFYHHQFLVFTINWVKLYNIIISNR